MQLNSENRSSDYSRNARDPWREIDLPNGELIGEKMVTRVESTKMERLKLIKQRKISRQEYRYIS